MSAPPIPRRLSVPVSLPVPAGRHPLVEGYLEDLRHRLPSAVPVVAAHLDGFFSAMPGGPLEVTVLDVLAFAAGRRPGDDVRATGRGADNGGPVPGISQLRNVSRFYDALVAHPGVPLAANPVPEMLADRRSRRRSPASGLDEPPVMAWPALGPGGPRAFLAAAPTARDRAIVAGSLFGGLRVGEIASLHVRDVHATVGHVIATGRQGRRRVVPVSGTFFAAVDDYLACERPDGLDTPVLFVAVKGQNRGEPLSTRGIQDAVVRLCVQVGLPPLNCGDLRLACLGALRIAGMEPDALRAFAGHPPAAGRPPPSEAEIEDGYRRAVKLLEVGWWDEGEDGATGGRPLRLARRRRVRRAR